MSGRTVTYSLREGDSIDKSKSEKKFLSIKLSRKRSFYIRIKILSSIRSIVWRVANSLLVGLLAQLPNLLLPIFVECTVIAFTRKNYTSWITLDPVAALRVDCVSKTSFRWKSFIFDFEILRLYDDSSNRSNLCRCRKCRVIHWTSLRKRGNSSPIFSVLRISAEIQWNRCVTLCVIPL